MSARVILKNLSVPAPVYSGLHLFHGLVFAELLVKKIVEELLVNCMVRLAFEHAPDLPK